MKDKCFDLGTIQAFTDGELVSDQSERLLKHVSGCGDCAALLSECEEESSFAFTILDDELNVLVPTERLRSKVFDSISEIEGRSRSGWLRGLSAGMLGAFSFKSPGFAAAFSVIIAVGALALFINVYRAPVGVNEVAVKTDPLGPVTMVEDSVRNSTPAPAESPASAGERTESGDTSSQFRVTNAVQRVPTRTRAAASQRNSGSADSSNALPEPIIVSEGSYLQTIATLERTVKFGKETLRPSERVSFERDLAVVNDAIVKLRDEVKRNPDNEGAREILKTSYQNKVDLLNSVAQKTELMASLQ